jgi:hypothetical protein
MSASLQQSIAARADTIRAADSSSSMRCASLSKSSALASRCAAVLVSA